MGTGKIFCAQFSPVPLLGLDEPTILENIQGAKFCPWGKEMDENIAKESAGLMVALHGRPFTSFPFHERLLDNLAQQGLHKTTIIQDLFLLPALRGQDIVVQAKRGSGKALGYILVLLERLLQEKEFGHKARSIVLVTEEDRAQKLSALAQGLAEGLTLRVSPFAAQDNLPEEQLKALEQGAELIFTTPYWLNRALARNLMPSGQVREYAFQLTDLARQLNAFAGSLKAQRRGIPKPETKIREEAQKYVPDFAKREQPLPLFTEEELEWLETVVEVRD